MRMSVEPIVQPDSLARELIEHVAITVLDSRATLLQVELEESGKMEVLKAVVCELIRNELVLSDYEVGFQVV